MRGTAKAAIIPGGDKSTNQLPQAASEWGGAAQDPFGKADQVVGVAFLETKSYNSIK